MRTQTTLAFLLVFAMTIGSAVGQTIWDGPIITFSKADSVDWTQEEHQDRISDSVWITRQHKQGIFNIVKESKYDSTSPGGTEWAYGTTANLGSLTFDSWIKINGNSPKSMIGKDAVLHLIAEDVYIDIKFLSFTGSNKGGGFSYERSTEPTADIEEVSPSDFNLYPNPTRDRLSVKGLKPGHSYIILDNMGRVLSTDVLRSSNDVDLTPLPPGIYTIVFEGIKPAMIRRL
ncbi:MAG: T9SS type A sorting domain-containing protein [Bacteroidia bacterium]|nr:T9SS type A sorting domain-containing protein [Bacteroidia bacterium]